jgi:hypothetical protein
MHRHGKRFQIYRGAFTCAGGATSARRATAGADDVPRLELRRGDRRDPQQSLLYTNLVYNDPVILRLDPPLLLNGAGPEADRTFTYCGYYDNGATNPQDVKRRSTSPPGGVIFDVFTVGGPCAQNETQCIGGPNQGTLCNGDNAVCDSGDCDACPLTGGFRTQDEMFILFGNYWETKNQ